MHVMPTPMRTLPSNPLLLGRLSQGEEVLGLGNSHSISQPHPNAHLKGDKINGSHLYSSLHGRDFFMYYCI